MEDWRYSHYEPAAAYGPYEIDEPARGGRVTPFRVAIAIALVGSIALMAYGLFVDRSGSQIPILVSGLAVFGLTLLVLAIAGAATSVRAAREGRGGRSFARALLGGFCALGAAGSLAAAVVLALLWRSAG